MAIMNFRRSIHSRLIPFTAAALILSGIIGSGSAVANDGARAIAQSSKAKTGSSEDAFDGVQSQAYVLAMDGKYDQAKPLVEQALKETKNPKDIASLYYLLSAINRMEDDYPAAIRNLQSVLKYNETAEKKDPKSYALLLKRLADCNWGMRNSKAALSNYSAALAECVALRKDDPIVPLILESITGTYAYDKDFKDAEQFGKRLLAVTSERAAASNDLDDFAALFWAKLQMLTIYRSLGNEDERLKLWKETRGQLDQLLAMRAEIEKRGGMEQLERMKQIFEEKYIKEFQPQTPAEYLWLASEFKMRSLPLINWAPDTGSPKAAILCIHGLGLENRSFGDFGTAMKERGYSVYAMDVRGFGSWQTTQGQEDVQFDEAIKDIRSMLTIIGEREKGAPIFLLGESMGGAIALRGAAANGDKLAGVISSVPSAELFQQRRMSLTVAKHLLHGKNRPFRVGDMVTEQATANEALSEKWKKDFKAKMEMTPKELIKFAVFMRSTKRECELITKTPVFVIQGLKDRLVKPEGTIELFEAVPGEDKNLLIMGTAEHLIFETFKPSKFLLDALTTWMDDHCKQNVPNAADKKADAAAAASAGAQ